MILFTPLFSHFFIQWAEYVIHHVLKSGWGVAQAKIHDHWFVEAVLGFEHCFVLIAVFDVYIIEPSFHIKLGEDKCVSNFCN